MVPETHLIIAACAFSIARYENQRWIRARMHGMQGANKWLGLVVDLTGLAGHAFNFLFLAAYLYDFGWAKALSFAAIVFALSFVSVFSRDRFWKWILGTAAIWPIMIYLGFQTTWFGLFR